MTGTAIVVFINMVAGVINTVIYYNCGQHAFNAACAGFNIGVAVWALIRGA
jgi:hypothetical protein